MDYFLICAIGSLITGFILGVTAGIAIAGKDNKRLENMIIELEDDLKFADDYLDKAHKENDILLNRRDRALAALTPKGASIGRKMARILKGEE